MSKGTKAAIFTLLVLAIKEIYGEADTLKCKTEQLIESLQDIIDHDGLDSDIIDELKYFVSKFEGYLQAFDFLHEDINELAMRLTVDKKES